MFGFDLTVTVCSVNELNTEGELMARFCIFETVVLRACGLWNLH